MNHVKKKMSIRMSLLVLMYLVFLNGFSGCDDDVVSYDLSITWTMDNPSQIGRAHV